MNREEERLLYVAAFIWKQKDIQILASDPQGRTDICGDRSLHRVLFCIIAYDKYFGSFWENIPGVKADYLWSCHCVFAQPDCKAGGYAF